MMDKMDDMGSMDEMMPEDEEMMAQEMPQKRGAFESMLQGIMPSQAELADLVGEGSPGFHEVDDQPAPGHDGVWEPGPMPESTGALGAGPEAGDYTGQAPYDPELVKQDIRALLAQKAQERKAASDEFQDRALE